MAPRMLAAGRSHRGRTSRPERAVQRSAGDGRPDRGALPRGAGDLGAAAEGGGPLAQVGQPVAAGRRGGVEAAPRSEEHTSELQSRPHLVCRLLLEKKKKRIKNNKIDKKKTKKKT